MIGMSIKLGKPRVEVDHSRPINKNAERFDGTVCEGESVAEYQHRLPKQIESQNWDSEDDNETES